MPAGRPRLYNSAAEIQDIVEAYFDELDDKIPTMAGLALKLGMTTQTLRNYSKEEEFFCTVKEARQRVETAWEQALIKGGAGPIFWLKNNAGWKDKSEQDVNSNNRNINTVEWVIKDKD